MIELSAAGSIGGESGEYARARELGPDMTHRRLEERLGSFARDTHVERTTFRERCVTAAAEVDQLRDTNAGWREVHATFERHNVGYEKYRMGRAPY